MPQVSSGITGTFAYNSLEVYLVSATTNSNITVSAGPQLLTQEPGSTVKHLDWPVATCLSTGDYNVRFVPQVIRCVTDRICCS